MKIEVKHEFDSSSDDVYALFTSEGFHEKKFEACGARNIKIIDKNESEDEFSITIDREIPADVPGVLKSFLGEWNKVSQTENWEDLGDGEYFCELIFKPEGVPLDVSGTMNLMPEGDGCVNHIEMIFDCGIPLVGGKLAEFAAKNSEKTLDDEFEFISDELS